MPPTNERDVYIIPQNFVDTGTVLGGTVKLRNALEAGTLFLCTAVPLFYLPLLLKTRIILVICISLPLAIFGIGGIGGDSLTQFLQHWFRFLRRRRIVIPTAEGNLDTNRQHHLRFVDRRKYRVAYYDDASTVPQGARILPRKADRHGKLVRDQTLYELIPISKIENGIIHTTDGRYVKILEIESHQLPAAFTARAAEHHRLVRPRSSKSHRSVCRSNPYPTRPT